MALQIQVKNTQEFYLQFEIFCDQLLFWCGSQGEASECSRVTLVYFLKADNHFHGLCLQALFH